MTEYIRQPSATYSMWSNFSHGIRGSMSKIPGLKEATGPKKAGVLLEKASVLLGATIGAAALGIATIPTMVTDTLLDRDSLLRSYTRNMAGTLKKLWYNGKKPSLKKPINLILWGQDSNSLNFGIKWGGKNQLSEKVAYTLIVLGGHLLASVPVFAISLVSDQFTLNFERLVEKPKRK